MASKGKGGSVAAAVSALAQPIADSLGLRIWDVTFGKEGTSFYLRIILDKDDGIAIEDCERFHRAINDPLDELDPIEQSYTLEVCSPGLERPLTKPAHFEACLGQRVQVRMIRPVDGERDFKGVLEDFDGANITVRLDSGKGFTMTKKETAFIKLDDFDTEQKG